MTTTTYIACSGPGRLISFSPCSCHVPVGLATTTQLRCVQGQRLQAAGDTARYNDVRAGSSRQLNYANGQWMGHVG